MVLLSFLQNARRQKLKQVRLFFDIETLTYNKKAGYDNPSEYKNVAFSVAVSFWNDNQLEIELFSNFFDFIQTIIQGFTKKNGVVYKTTPKIILVAHNANKYDNHFLFTDLQYYYPNIKVVNEYMKSMLFTNDNTFKLKDLKNEPGDYIFTRMVKAKSSLSLKFRIEGVFFETEDTFLKLNMSLRKIGEKLNRLTLLDDKYLKTDFDYKKFDVEYNMSDYQAHDYALRCFNQLTDEQLVYIRNDVVILGYAVKYYNSMYPDFDYKKPTFSSNILNLYDQNPITHLQLRNKYKKIYLKYTEFSFANMNLYDYLKSFYFGGLNFYNDNYIGKIVDTKCFNIDLNSSYPNSMYRGKFPAKLLDFKASEQEFKIKIDLSSDYYYLMQISKFEFDRLLSDVQSEIIKKMFVKYYSRINQKVISINSFTIRTLNDVAHLNIKELNVKNYLVFDTIDFGNKEEISQNYFVKSQGKAKTQLKYNSPYNIVDTGKINTNHFTDAEVAQAKVVLNGLYGLPALRAYFHLFLFSDDATIESYPAGYQNVERNILFSLYVTSYSFYNLINPLKYLRPSEIDQDFLYCDTDSLYFKRGVINEIPDNILNDFELGKWKIEHENIKKFFILNHKKYCFLNGDTNQIEIRCGGVPKDSFNINMSFESFINTQFSAGVQLHNLKSILNKQGTISIYDSITELDQGGKYSKFMDDALREKAIDELLKEFKKADDLNNDDIIYIDSNLVTVSVNDLHYRKHDKNTLFSIKDFQERLNYCYSMV